MLLWEAGGDYTYDSGRLTMGDVGYHWKSTTQQKRHVRYGINKNAHSSTHANTVKKSGY